MAKGKAVETRRSTSIVIFPSVWKAARMQAIAEGRPTAHLVEQCIREYLARVQKESK